LRVGYLVEQMACYSVGVRAVKKVAKRADLRVATMVARLAVLTDGWKVALKADLRVGHLVVLMDDWRVALRAALKVAKRVHLTVDRLAVLKASCLAVMKDVVKAGLRVETLANC